MNRLVSTKNNTIPSICQKDESKEIQTQKEIEYCYLDKNENPYPMPSDISSMTIINFQLQKYPDSCYTKLTEELAKKFDVPSTNFILTSGSDELIDLIFRGLIKPKGSILTIEPTFQMYKSLSKLNLINIKTIEARTKETNEVLLQQSICQKSLFSKLKTVSAIILARPNNPDGQTIDEDMLLSLLESKKFVIIDEAYIDFSDSVSAIKYLKEFDNLLILRTFSKTHSCAGLRLGYGIMERENCQRLTKMKLPYNVNSVASELGSILLENEEIKQNILRIKRTRKLFEAQLTALAEKCKSFKFFPSEANFVLLRFDTKSVLKRVQLSFLRSDIFVRSFEEPKLNNFLRISIGTESQMERVCNTLNEALENKK